MADSAFSSKNPRKFYSSKPLFISRFTQSGKLPQPAISHELEFHLNKENEKDRHAIGSDRINDNCSITSNSTTNKDTSNTIGETENNVLSSKRKYELCKSYSDPDCCSKKPLQSLQPQLSSHAETVVSDKTTEVELDAAVPQIVKCISNNKFLKEEQEGIRLHARCSKETSFDAVFSKITHNVGKVSHKFENSKKKISVSNENTRVKRQYKSLDIKRVASAKARFASSSTMMNGNPETVRKSSECSTSTSASLMDTVASVIDISTTSTTSPCISSTRTMSKTSSSVASHATSTESSSSLSSVKPALRTSTFAIGSPINNSAEQKWPSNCSVKESWLNKEDRCLVKTNHSRDENSSNITTLSDEASTINNSTIVVSACATSTTTSGSNTNHNKRSKIDNGPSNENMSATPNSIQHQTTALSVDFESPILFDDEHGSSCSSPLFTTCDSGPETRCRNIPTSPSSSGAGTRCKNTPCSPSLSREVVVKVGKKISPPHTPPIVTKKHPDGLADLNSAQPQQSWSNSLKSSNCAFTTSMHSSNDKEREEVQNVICKLLLSPRETCSEGKVSPGGKKTPKKQEKVNTILNYFQMSPQVEKTSPGSPGSGSCDCGDDVVEVKIRKKKKQGILTQSPMFDLPIPRPRLNAAYRRGPIHSRMKDKKKTIKKSVRTNKKEQMYIDIGQKNFGHVKCTLCGMIYTEANEDDESQHTKFHQKIVAKLQFKGWKDERVVEECADGRIIMVTKDDHPSHVKKLAEVREVVDAELGFSNVQNSHAASEQQAFLFVMAKKVVGCAIAVHISKAYPVIPHQSDEMSSPSGSSSATTSWCCSADAVPALIGVSRIWVLSHHRRRGIATRLVESIRYNCLYGCVVPKDQVAFSDPTPNGRSFAEKYMGKKEILVFR